MRFESVFLSEDRLNSVESTTKPWVCFESFVVKTVLALCDVIIFWIFQLKYLVHYTIRQTTKFFEPSLLG